jgi:hypothetical protein
VCKQHHRFRHVNVNNNKSFKIVFLNIIQMCDCRLKEMFCEMKNKNVEDEEIEEKTVSHFTFV